MSELLFPWLELAILIPATGALWVGRMRDPDTARRHSLVISGLSLACSIAAWQDFSALGAVEAHDPWDAFWRLAGGEVFAIDELSAPLLPLASLLYLLTHLATLRTKVRRFSFAWSLAADVGQLPPGQGLNALFERYDAAYLDVEPEAIPADLDTSDDYDRLRREHGA